MHVSHTDTHTHTHHKKSQVQVEKKSHIGETYKLGGKRKKKKKIEGKSTFASNRRKYEGPYEGLSNETHSFGFGFVKRVNKRWCHLRGGRGASSKGGLVSREPPEAHHRTERSTPGVHTVSRPRIRVAKCERNGALERSSEREGVEGGQVGKVKKGRRRRG